MKNIRPIKSIIILFAIFQCLFNNVRAQNVNIPDANFKAALVANSAINTNMDTAIQVSEANSYTGGIDVSNQNIYDLTGIEAFTSIVSLNCYQDYLTSLDLSNNTVIVNVDCRNNNLSSLNVNGCLSLYHLACDNNYLSGININNNPTIYELYCSNNYMSGLDVSGCTSLWGIDCHNNNLTFINANGCSSLENIDCYNNQITTFDFTGCNLLRVINGFNNNLVSLDLTDYPLLWLDVSNNTSLTTLIYNYNPGFLPSQTTDLLVNGCTSLETLQCNGRHLTDLDVSDCINLTQLWCDDNFLVTLNLNNNSLLYDFHINNNGISMLDVSHNPDLGVFICINNNLSEIDISNNSMLFWLFCDNNQITSLDVSNETYLNELGCSNNLITELDVTNDTDLNQLYCNNNLIQELYLNNNPNLSELICNNNNLNKLDLRSGNNTAIQNLDARNNTPLSCIQVDNPVWSNNQSSWHINGNSHYAYDCLYDNYSLISGTLYADTNCNVDGNETKLKGFIFKTYPDNFYGISDTNGIYTIRVDTGTYNIEEIIPTQYEILSFPHCPNSSYYTLEIDSFFQDTSGIDFFNTTAFCPYLTIALNIHRRRTCFTNTTLVNFCNDGFADANNVDVHVQLPNYVNFISADYPYNIDSTGNYVFDIGTLAPGDCGNIHIIDSTSCLAEITGLTQCTKAWITPANDCVNSLDTSANNLWDHSSIVVEGECIGDTVVHFVIINTGTGDMQQSSDYRLYADNMLNYTGTFQLTSQDSLVLNIQANGQTIRLEADQNPYHPGNSHPNVTIEACGEPYNSMGFVNTLPMDDDDADVDIDCREIISGYDPNDKEVSPEGITSNNYLSSGTMLNYTINFQNTGNDTALTVKITDTLSEFLDISTFQFSLSSHPCNINLSGHGIPVISFIFTNIDLPDSTTDEANSHGFVKFKIAPFDSLSNGTEIHNDADIYFDYNAPVTTNDTRITVSDTVISGSTINFDMANLYTDSLTICEGDSILWRNNYYSIPDNYSENYTNIYNCDSIYTLYLYNYPAFHSIESQEICNGDSLLWQENYYNSTGQYTVSNVSINGCDSIHELILIVNPLFDVQEDFSICEGDSFLWQGNYYDTAGIYYENYSTIAGCDSIFEMQLNVNNNPVLGNIFGADTVDLNQVELYYILDDSLVYYWSIDNGIVINQLSNNVCQIQWDSLGMGYIYIVAENQYGCQSDTLSYGVVVGTTSDKYVTGNNQINIFPNPANKYIYIDYNKPFTLEIYTFSGKKLIESTKSQIDISKLSPATYLVVIKNKYDVIIKTDKITIQ